MNPALHSFFSRLRRVLSFLPALLKKLPGMQPRDNEAPRNRMCPFCGLITPRSKRQCLECGKSLKPA